MTTSLIHLPKKLTQQLLTLAQQSPTAEICGLIGARNGLPCHCYPVANAATDPARRFELEPKAQIAAMKTMRERGETLFAVYHSHPTDHAFPSPADIEQASDPKCLYLIVSLATHGVLELRGFRIEHGQVTEQSLRFGEL